ncbi:MAG: RNA polymerase sigma factor [Candidatus Thiodiazotropha sp. (ex Dulcina madagascariensis)]|nr:RNA polymerase sigma factor [Candidatus Thiodiazotropha sp. (ex Dulcina madagascariensis)]
MTLAIWRRRRLEKILLHEYAMLHRLAWSWCHNRHTADELVQETCLLAMEHVEQLKDNNKARQWIVKIMVNLHHDRMRSLRESVDVETLNLASPDSVESLALQEDRISQIRDAVASLKYDQRIVLTLVDLMGYSYVQVAETLDIPIGTVMSRLTRARGKLKDKLLNHNAEATGWPNLRRVK